MEDCISIIKLGNTQLQMVALPLINCNKQTTLILASLNITSTATNHTVEVYLL